jgi:spore coat protein U-like protein
MKKLALSLLAVAALAAAPSAAFAQTGVINATATIQTVLNFGESQALDFGAVTPGTAATASGWIQLNRNVGAVVTLPDAANTGRLTGPGGAYLTPSYTSCGVGTTSSAITSAFSSCTPATGTTTVLTLTAPAAGTTTEYVIFNGSLSAAQTNITPGTYNGTIRISVASN